ncbi:MAG: hypothetical protein ACREBC_31815 [Pyrinomonadaceae bacterium]
MIVRTDIYPPIEEWFIPNGACAATLAGVRPAGERGSEAGAFWLGGRSFRSRIEAVVLPSGSGVEEYSYRWRVSPEVFGEVTRWAKPLGLFLLGVAHTHLPGVPVDLSWVDRTEGVRAPDMLASVIGNGGLDESHHDWGWFVYEDNDYRRMPANELSKRFM